MGVRQAGALDLLRDVRLDAYIVLDHARCIVDGRQEKLIPEGNAPLLVIQQVHLQARGDISASL